MIQLLMITMVIFLWKLDRKIQARYFWSNVLSFEDTEEEMKEKINIKLISGPQNT